MHSKQYNFNKLCYYRAYSEDFDLNKVLENEKDRRNT